MVKKLPGWIEALIVRKPQFFQASFVAVKGAIHSQGQPSTLLPSIKFSQQPTGMGLPKSDAGITACRNNKLPVW